MSEYYVSDDYIGLRFPGGSFYYGYECCRCEKCKTMLKPGCEACDQHEDAGAEWCFRAIVNGQETLIPRSALDCDQFDVVECLLAGIAKYLTKHKIGPYLEEGEE